MEEVFHSKKSHLRQASSVPWGQQFGKVFHHKQVQMRVLNISKKYKRATKVGEIRAVSLEIARGWTWNIMGQQTAICLFWRRFQKMPRKWRRTKKTGEKEIVYYLCIVFYTKNKVWNNWLIILCKLLMRQAFILQDTCIKLEARGPHWAHHIIFFPPARETLCEVLLLRRFRLHSSILLRWEVVHGNKWKHPVYFQNKNNDSNIVLLQRCTSAAQFFIFSFWKRLHSIIHF